MSKPLRSTGQVVLLGMVISLGFLGFAVQRPALKAQEPVKAVDKKALREQIVTLHAEIDLLEVEQGVDRHALADLIQQERGIVAALPRLGRNENRVSFAGENPVYFLDWFRMAFFDIMDIEQSEALEISKLLISNEKNPSKDQMVEKFSEKFAKDLSEQLVKIGQVKAEDFPEARQRFGEWLLQEAASKATEDVRESSAVLKKEFTRRSIEIAGKKLDLETLERQFREAR